MASIQFTIIYKPAVDGKIALIARVFDLSVDQTIDWFKERADRIARKLLDDRGIGSEPVALMVQPL